MTDRRDPRTVVDTTIVAAATAEMQGNPRLAENTVTECENLLNMATAEIGNGPIDFAKVKCISGGAGEVVQKIVETHSRLTAARAVLALAGPSLSAAEIIGLAGAGPLSDCLATAMGGGFDMPGLLARGQGGVAIPHGAIRAIFGGDGAMAATFIRSDGLPPQVMRSDRVSDAVTNPLSVFELYGLFVSTDQAKYRYVQETITAAAAAEVAEGAKEAEVDLSFANVDVDPQTIRADIPVTEEQLADEPSARRVLDNRLRFFARQRFDRQLVIGSGVAPNIQGIVGGATAASDKTAGAAANARIGDPIALIGQAVGGVRTIGKVNATGIMINPTVWFEDIALAKSTTGEYVLGSPSLSRALFLHGLPVALADDLADGDTADDIIAVAGDFLNSADIVMRQDVRIDAGWIGDDFAKNSVRLRVSLRAAQAIYRPQAFVRAKRGANT